MHAMHRNRKDDELINQRTDIEISLIGRNDSHVFRLFGILIAKLDEENPLILDGQIKLISASVTLYTNLSFNAEFEGHHRLLTLNIKPYGHITLLNLRIFQTSKEIILDLEPISMIPQGKAADRDAEFVFILHLPKLTYVESSISGCKNTEIF